MEFHDFFKRKGRRKLLHSSLSGIHLCLVVWIEEQSIWTFPKPILSVHPDGPNPPDTGGEEIREISEGPSGAQVWNGTKGGSETKVSLLCPHRYCLDNCISDKLLGCEGGKGGVGDCAQKTGLQPGKAGHVDSSYEFYSNPINLTDISEETAAQSPPLFP